MTDTETGEGDTAVEAQAIHAVGPTVITYTYDSLNRLTGAEYSTGERFEYAYDAVGNRTAMTEATSLDETTVTTYTYDAANRLLVSSSPGHLVTYGWDARGNLVSDGVFTYTYSAAGRMVRAEGVTLTLVYTYNANGLRVAQSVDGDVITFTWDWATGVPELLATTESTNPEPTLYLVGHETLARWDGVAWAYHLPDALGSVRQAADGAGAVVSAREWTPFGVEMGTAQAGLGYTEEWFDAEVGLTYLRARWYDARVGRFTRRDPFSGVRVQPLSLNPYLYVLANPINAADPSGLYGPEVHRDLTRQLVLEMAAIVAAVTDAEELANRIAEGDQHVDDSWELNALPPYGCNECHFCPLNRTMDHVETAIASGNPFLFGASLHQYQDWYSHWHEGYTWQHAADTALAKTRTWIQIQDFYWGYHIQPWPPFIVFSPFPAHPRDEVIQNIQRRNPGIDLNGLSDSDLIDLYQRKDITDPNWQLRVEERSYFGLDTDRYFENSSRDTSVRVGTMGHVLKFLIHITDPCAIDWEIPDDAEIEALLTE